MPIRFYLIMEIDKNVHKMPRLLNSIKFRGFAIGSRIYLRDYIYDDLKSDKPNPLNVGVLIHEQYHARQFQKCNSNFDKILMGLKYYLSRKYRLQEELNANRVQFRYLKQNGLTYDLDTRAKHLSGIYYLWCSSYEEAKEKLVEVWEKA